MLGHKLYEKLQNEFEVWTTLRSDFEKYRKIGLFDPERVLQNVDVESEQAISEAVAQVKPDVIINAAGIIKQVPTSKNVIKTLNVNSIFPHRLAELAKTAQARLITVSTDCVFSGKKGNYAESDAADALDLYGRSKWLGEVQAENCLTIRTSIIGRELDTTHSLIEWFLSQKGKTIKGYVNATYTGFPTVVLSELIGEIIKNHPALEGLYHVSTEPISKYEMLCMIRDELELDIEIEPFEDFFMDRSLRGERFAAATGLNMPDWKTLIRRFAADPFPYERIRNILMNQSHAGSPS